MIQVIFLGPPGAGKGTQAACLAEWLKVPHVSTGDILRHHVAEKTDLGQQAKSYMDEGDLVPDQLILDMIQHRLEKPDAQPGWILDGFPRNVAQATFVETQVVQTHEKAQELQVINLDVPDEVIIQRLLARGRQDDTEQIIRHRLEVYREQTAPLIEFYDGRNQLSHINGDKPVEEVTAQLKQSVAA